MRSRRYQSIRDEIHEGLSSRTDRVGLGAFRPDDFGKPRVDWTLDAMIAEQQCEFFRRFDPERDCVWIAMSGGIPRGALTIDGPRPETGREAARLRFFVLDESLRGRGLVRVMVADALRFCRDKHYHRVFLTTLPGLDAAMRLYTEHGFQQIAENDIGFHGSVFVEQTFECKLD